MKKQRRKEQTEGVIDLDEILSEYDFSRAEHNKYASIYAGPSKKAKRVIVIELSSVPPDLGFIFMDGFSEDSVRQRFMARMTREIQT